MAIHIRGRNIFIAFTATAFLCGCVTPAKNASSGATAGRNDSADPCGVGASAATGALAGALLGALTGGKNSAIKGAAIGGIAGAILCVGINSKSQQTKTAAETSQDYQRTGVPIPREPVLVSYTPQVSNEVAKRGQPVHVTSTLELVNGSALAVQDVREELLVFDPQGQQIKSGSKPVGARTGGGLKTHSKYGYLKTHPKAFMA
jgi:predicted lipid-binding transport protein (Tim44 family)